MHMGVCVLDDLALTQDVKLEHVVEVRLPVRFLWAHLVVHVHDELLPINVHARTTCRRP
jgi:hypothetical protein